MTTPRHFYNVLTFCPPPAALCFKIVCSWFVAQNWQAKVQQYFSPSLFSSFSVCKKHLARWQAETFEAQLHHACCMVTEQWPLVSACQLGPVAHVIFKGCTLTCYLWVGVRTEQRGTVWHFHISILCDLNRLQKDLRCFPTWRISLGATRTDICIHTRNTHEHIACIQVHIHYLWRSTDVHICMSVHFHLQVHTNPLIDIHSLMLANAFIYMCLSTYGAHIGFKVHKYSNLNFPCG